MEILSPEQKPHKVMSKLLHCLEFGCQLGWFLDPDDRRMLLFQPNQQPKLLQGNDRLPVPTWLALALMANQVFGWLQMAAE
ncbi:MAG: Uma2 family endonuclease [Verrucomicrobia bacterium]|nr:Uma2 family endonuclease [Leptolyngbya sp. ES-bin-22]